MPRVVVTVLAPGRRFDLSVPDEVPVERLLPEIVEVLEADPDARWALTPRGDEPLPPHRTLTESGVLHGAVLLLVERRSVMPPELPPAAAAPPAIPSSAPATRPPSVAPIPVAPAPRPAAAPPAAGRVRGGAAPYHFPRGATAGAAPVVDLLVVAGPSAGLRVPLPAGEHRVGGHRYSRVVLDDPTLSRVHLLVRVGAGGDVTVADAGSELGTLLDGAPLLGRMPVPPGRVVAAGRSLIAFARPGSRASSAGPAGQVAAGGAVRLEPPSEPPRTGWPPALGAAAVLGVAAIGGFVASHLNPTWLLLAVLLPPAAAAWPLLRQSVYRSTIWIYRDRLGRLDMDLAVARSAEAARLRAATPDAVAVLELARSTAAPPPARRPGGPDWLVLRLGWGDAPSGITLGMPAGGAQALRQEAERMLARHQVLPAVPTLVSLRDAGGVGVTGNHLQVAALCRWLAIQLATLHAPSDLRLVAAVATGDRERWSWLEWLPHAGRSPGPMPAGAVVAGNTVRPLVEGLLALADERLAAADAGAPRAGPAVVAFLAEDADLNRGALPRLLVQGPAVGIYVIWVGREAGRLPPECGVAVEVPAGRLPPTVSLRWQGVRRVLGGVDGLSLPLAVDAARALGGRPAFPARVDLVELLALPADLERHVLERWIRDRSGTADRALAAVVGLAPDGTAVTVDLRRAGHVLVAGAAGSGKSELLRCLATSLALGRSPRALTLALIDPGAALTPCAGLPHVVRHATGVEGGDGRPALAWLEQELARRAAVLREEGAADMDELELARPERAPARLVVLADGRSDLLAPAATARALAEAGRRLGVHLVLASDRPDRLPELPGFRVALRCADERESEALIGCGDAARSLPLGRGFLCAEPGQVVEFQGAFAGDQRLRRLVAAVAQAGRRVGGRPGSLGPAASG
jgi:S-DNA-T family DNA segregation ATPase FtsK/SpoIIIE